MFKVKSMIELKLEIRRLEEQNAALTTEFARAAVRLHRTEEQLAAAQNEHLQDITELEEELDRMAELRDTLLRSNSRLALMLKERGVELGDAEHFICLSAEEV